MATNCIIVLSKIVGGASAASEATLSSCQSRFAIYVGIVVHAINAWGGQRLDVLTFHAKGPGFDPRVMHFFFLLLFSTFFLFFYLVCNFLLLFFFSLSFSPPFLVSSSCSLRHFNVRTLSRHFNVRTLS